MITIGTIEQCVNSWYPPGTAESWDRVGLVTGARDQEVTSVLLTVDVTDAVTEQAIRSGAGLIIAHHPLVLRGIHAVDPADPKGRMLTRLIRHEIGLITAHTNADIPCGGVADALAATLGLSDRTPLLPSSTEQHQDELDKIVSYVPHEHTATVIDALADAGAGVLGNYDRCSYQTAGTGQFRPLPGSDPYAGAVDEVSQVAEVRVEMILPRRLRDRVRTALLASHPYEHPAYDITELAAPRDSADGDSPAAPSGLGRVGTIAATRLADFADQVAARLPATAGGIRVAGDPDRPVSSVAVQAGAGDGLLATARMWGADVYLTSDLRHHPASEAIAWADAPALIDISHWAAEWTWLPVLRDRLLHAFQDHRPTPSVVVSQVRTDAWTWTVGAETR